DIKIYEIVPWRTKIQDRYDFRQSRLLSDLELVLTLLFPTCLNSALGGFIPRYRPPVNVKSICEAAVKALPQRPQGTHDSHLATRLSKRIDDEKNFFKHLREETPYDVGEEISGESFASIKHHLLDRLFSVNGAATSLCVLRDVTREEFLNQITPGFFSPQKGRAMAAHDHMLGTIARMHGVDPDMDFTESLPPYVDFWRLMLGRKYWSLHGLMMHLLLREMNPLCVLGYGTQVMDFFIWDKGLQLATEVELGDTLDKGLARGRVMDRQAPRFANTMASMGHVLLIQTGMGEHQSLFLGNLHPGSEFYEPSLRRFKVAVQFLINVKAQILQRFIEYHASILPIPDEQGSRRIHLEYTKTVVEKHCQIHGLNDLLKTAIDTLMQMNSGERALRGKHLSGGVLVRAPFRSKSFPWRTLGICALGAPNSNERRAQLANMRRISAMVDQSDGSSRLFGPGNCHPDTQQFEEWHLNLAPGTSLWLSANRYGRSEEAMAAVIANNGNLAKWNKDTFAEERKSRARAFGSWEAAILNERVPLAAVRLSNGETDIFSSSICTVQCDDCERWDVRWNWNSWHRCEWNGDKHKIKCRSYNKSEGDSTAPMYKMERMLFPKDLIEHHAVQQHVSQDVLLSEGFYQDEAIGYLVDDRGNVLSNLPIPLDPYIIGDACIWRRDNTPPKVCLGSSLDLLLQQHARDNESIPSDTASSSAEFLWNKKAEDRVLKVIQKNPMSVWVCVHRECGHVTLWKKETYGSLMTDHKCGPEKGYQEKRYQYDLYEVYRFTDLPYVLTRVYTYKALVEENDDFLKVLRW
ncbi:hypothetical protein CPB86DRAFT_661953, partial [Serendipita vermifera]